MKIVTGEQMKAFDARAIEELGIPSLVLMENAGRRVAEAVAERWGDAPLRVLALSGKGNNGGDALCAARHLVPWGAEAEALLVGSRDELSEPTRTQVRMLEASEVPLHLLQGESELDRVDELLARADLVVDGLLGVGVRGAVRGLSRPVIARANAHDTPTIAVDLPSGVEADTGRVEGEAIEADATVTFEFPKLGLLLHPGRSYAGELLVRTIGYPDSLKAELATGLAEIEATWVRERLPRRPAPSHKGDHGRALMLAGSRGLSGAAVLAAEAALRTGAGLVYMGYPASLGPILEARVLEAVQCPLPEQDGVLAEAAADTLGALQDRLQATTLAAGPGLARAWSVRTVLHKILPAFAGPVVLDADGINNLADDAGRELVAGLQVPTVLTPHPGELSRLLDREVAAITGDPVGIAREVARDWGVVLVLKGAPTVVGLPCGEVLVNATGNAGLATGGSGDVLTGMIAALLAQGMSVEDAAPAGVYLHGLLADRLVPTMGQRAMLPRDLLEIIPTVLRDFE